MLNVETLIESLRQEFGASDTPVLSIYTDVNPARPENAKKAWVKRVKNSLLEIPEIRNRQGKRDTPLYDEVYALLDQDRPEARTMALFAKRDKHDKIIVERLDLQVDLPVVDVAHGRVDARYGEPYLTPILFAADEYERLGVLHLFSTKWRFYEIFLGEIREEENVFADITVEEWRELKKLADKISETYSSRSLRQGGRFDKLSPKDRLNAKVSVWMHQLYSRLADLAEKTAGRLGIERFVLMGEEWQVKHFETHLDRGLRSRIVARVPHPKNPAEPSKREIMEVVGPALEASERAAEMELLDRIKEQPGLWGLDPVLDALQPGRVEVLVLPWSLEAKIWRCPEEGFVAATEETAKIFCEAPVEVRLRDHVWQLSRDFGARVEFLRGEPEKRLLTEFQGAAALVRW